MPSPELIEARNFADKLRNSLPSSVDAAALGVWSKAPFQILCAREALIWRTEELTRNACDTLDRGDLAVGAILARAIVENAALTWKLMELLDTREQYSAKDLSESLTRLLVGSRKWEDLPKAFQILSSVDRMDKRISGVRASYDSLSEIAHPNWAGVLGLYSETDKSRFMTRFGRGLRGSAGTQSMILNTMLGALELFDHAYNRISDVMPAFLGELEPISPGGDRDSDSEVQPNT
jgi:hypothetical protein